MINRSQKVSRNFGIHIHKMKQEVNKGSFSDLCVVGRTMDIYDLYIGRLLIAFLLCCLFSFEGVETVTSGSAPSQRTAMGFQATPQGMLYLFGGRNINCN